MLRRSGSTKSVGSAGGTHTQLQDPVAESRSLSPPETRTRSTSLLSSFVRRLPGSQKHPEEGSGRKRATTTTFEYNPSDTKARLDEKKRLEDALKQLKTKDEMTPRDKILAVTIEGQLAALDEFTKSPTAFLFEPPDHFLSEHLLSLTERAKTSDYVHPDADVVTSSGATSPVSSPTEPPQGGLPRSRAGSLAPSVAVSVGSDGEGGGRRRRCSFIANTHLYVDGPAPPVAHLDE